MGAIHQAFRGDAGQYPVKFQNFGNVGLAVKRSALGIQPARQPSGGNGARGLVNHGGVMAFDNAVIIGQEKIAFGVFRCGGLDGGPDGADIVAQVRNACGGDSGEDTFFCHEYLS